ncbi:MAG: AAA family ATPase, partial [Cyanobacteria bacterium J06648_11]
THQPAEATQTYLCEGEWDAISLGWQLRYQSDIAVACFTCGCNAVPSPEVLARLPGQVTVFYDRDDKPLKNGTVPGEAGAQKVAQALGTRARIALVPQRPEHAQARGWDVSDALAAGFTMADFAEAAECAVPFVPPAVATPAETRSDAPNPLRSRLVHNDTLLDRAPDYTEWLVPDLLTANELFLLAASPRAGKSLLAMTLALSIASGQKFLDRPVTQGSVLYICCEDSETKIKEREIAQGWTRGLPVYWLDRFKLSELSHLRAIAEELEPRLIVFDTLSRIRDDGISESSAEMSRCLEPLQEMAEELNCCILLVHHTGKVKLDNADKIDVFETIRGSSAIRAVCRGSWVLAADDNSCYRLCVEHGYGKEDLRLALDASTLRWQSLGGWQPAMVNPTQAERVL